MDNFKELVIYSKKEELTEGMFGQALSWIISFLLYIENVNLSDNIKVFFDINTLPNGNLIPKFIVPKLLHTDTQLNSPLYIDLRKWKTNGYPNMLPINYTFTENTFEITNKIFNKWFTFSDELLTSIPNFNTDDTLGIHYRGTDKNYDNSQTNPITQYEFILIIKDFLKNSNINFKSIYCASDEEMFIVNIIKEFPHLSVIVYDQKRASDNSKKGFFREGAKLDITDQDKMTIASLVDMISLSKCHTVLKTSSALSVYSKIINPNINLYTVNAMKMRFFPAAYVKPYKSNSLEINKILKRTMKNDCGFN